MNSFDPQIVAFYCENCASAAADVSDDLKKVMPANVKLVKVPCTGRIEILHLLSPFEAGADGVYVAGCQDDSCQYISGVTQAAKRVNQVKKILEDMGIEPERIDMFHLSAARGQSFVDVAYQMVERLKTIHSGSSTANA